MVCSIDMARRKLQASFLSAVFLGSKDTDSNVHSLVNDSLLSFEGLHLQKRDFPLAAKGKATETGIYSLSDPNNALYGKIFGHLLLKDETKRNEDDYRCEGLLIGPNHVLTVYPECDPSPPAAGADTYHKNTVAAGEKVVYQYTKKAEGTDGVKIAVEVKSMWRTIGSKYLIALIADDSDLKGIDKDHFPLLSWTKQPDARNYGTYLETAQNYPVLLSTPTAVQSLKTHDFNEDLKWLLQRSTYEDHPEAIKLRKGGVRDRTGDLDDSLKVGGKAKPLDGAAFFKPTGDTVALIGIRSKEWTKKCREGVPIGIRAIKRSKPGPILEAGTFHCGYRLDYTTVKELYQTGLAVHKDLPRDNNKVFPQEKTGRWNAVTEE